ncbi:MULTISPECIES: TetR/AcrR family transcriptional regulator [Gordonia]|jgi:AcrR family transcriptional regulator|uniref:TetR family transcriptional regulator n=2 Tax=Gordonia alkanivorans TaxID=84096 RepID=W9DIJ2_9ACTN|nr:MULTISPECIES: TetR/AcrR family transcriptional regulator [Gordonia]AZZ80672.1 TetR/AcrR family transcriptional regulator [Gordonia alkanivorans]ETA08382.1 TetR family transcriptional regulator [Gordonia alkanivorans CGMCC 6845]MDH3005945.1 TetR/AcrR family transcriptional regulator [Gordonia alkanivorans]MDH3011263.1 TetR/AcrR family transcriptional regulator [Gordonia alkanivorans]MDH3015700.1 TetR/AcrR family transcriptional regulator [Gordonia alkanivorans]
MPKISAERKLERSQQILDAARRCFAEKGFHRASMSDVIRESGLSAGAVYSYYSSKEQLIAAVARSVFLAYESGLGDLVGGDGAPASPEDAIRMLAARVMAEIAPLTDDFRMVMTIWGEAANNPELREIVREIILGLRKVFEHVLVRWRDSGHELPGEPAELALPMVSVMQGVVVQQSLVGDVDLDAYVDTWCALMRAAGLGDQG